MGYKNIEENRKTIICIFFFQKQNEKFNFNRRFFMGVIKKPDLSDPVLRAKLAKGMGHNYYGEPAWPNDLLYIFPVCILGTFCCIIGLSVLDPSASGEPANPFATPLEILLNGAIPLGLMAVPFIESINKFQNPFRRPI